jgi:predicted SAM-dependent methyltransferase
MLIKNIKFKIADSIYNYSNKLSADFRLKRLAKISPLRVVVGAGRVCQKDWIPTEIDQINLLKTDSWDKFFTINSIDAILAEHVWEHLTEQEASIAAHNCFNYLKSHGYIRVAVPDGLKPSNDYINAVKPGGTGAGAEDHKVLYNYKTISKLFESAGFEIELLEYYDEEGNFHYKEWDPENGLIHRSSRYDERNQQGNLNYTSIIIDAKKK